MIAGILRVDVTHVRRVTYIAHVSQTVCYRLRIAHSQRQVKRTALCWATKSAAHSERRYVMVLHRNSNFFFAANVKQETYMLNTMLAQCYCASSYVRIGIAHHVKVHSSFVVRPSRRECLLRDITYVSSIPKHVLKFTPRAHDVYHRLQAGDGNENNDELLHQVPIPRNVRQEGSQLPAPYQV